MTTGAYTTDNKVPYGSTWIGSYVQKSWNGGDQIKLARVIPTFYDIHREVYDKATRKWVLKKFRVRSSGYSLKRSRKREPHDYLMSYLRLEQGIGVHPETGPTVDMWRLSGALTTWGAHALLDANDQIKLVGKLREQLSGSDFNMSVFLGESHQTLRLLGDTALRLAKAAHHARRLDGRGTFRSLFEGTNRKPLKVHDWTNSKAKYASQNVSSLWLEAQYGWLPLLKDAEGAAQALAHALSVPFSQTHRVSVQRNNAWEGSQEIGASFSVIATVPMYNSHRRGLIAVISEPPSVAVQLGLLDPELVAWELLPFSFIADWFIPIGQWMEARALASRLRGTFITSDKRVGVAGPASIPGGSTTDARYYQVLFSRMVSTTLDVPMPTLKSLDKVASWQHCANAIALVIGAFTGKKVT